ncbi:hypothetical protein D3C72_2436430 [compost metagenome]
MTNCQVSLKPKIGPLNPHTKIRIIAPRNVVGLPVQRASFWAIFANFMAVFLIGDTPEIQTLAAG